MKLDLEFHTLFIEGVIEFWTKNKIIINLSSIEGSSLLSGIAHHTPHKHYIIFYFKISLSKLILLHTLNLEHNKIIPDTTNILLYARM